MSRRENRRKDVRAGEGRKGSAIENGEQEKTGRTKMTKRRQKAGTGGVSWPGSQQERHAGTILICC